LTSGWKEYRKSLKDIEVEELIDLYFYRILGYGFVKLVSWSRMTPNQVTYLGMIFGVLSATFFVKSSLIAAALLLLLANVMDCADGQLARLKKNGTYLGGVIDGFFDYIVGGATIIGIGIFLCRQHDPRLIIPFTLLTGLSRAFQNILVDQRRHFFVKSTSYDTDCFQGDQEALIQYQQKLQGTDVRLLDRLIIRSGFNYIAIQRFAIRMTHVTFADYKTFNDYPDHRAFLLRCWSFLGSSTHITLAILAALMDHLEWYFWIAVMLGNLAVFFLVISENVLVDRFEKITMEVE
jgi:hypothetical protein